MNAKQIYWPINWTAGSMMKVSHLDDQYRAHSGRIRDAAALPLNSFNYGLLGGVSHQKFADSFRDNMTNEKIEVSFCRAITQNGSRIEI